MLSFRNILGKFFQVFVIVILELTQRLFSLLSFFGVRRLVMLLHCQHNLWGFSFGLIAFIALRPSREVKALAFFTNPIFMVGYWCRLRVMLLLRWGILHILIILCWLLIISLLVLILSFTEQGYLEGNLSNYGIII